MRMPDVLAPYASLIKWGLIALLSVGLFASGCNYGQHRQEDKVATLQDKVVVLEAANASWADEARERQERAAEDQKAGDKLMREGEKAADRSDKEQKRTEGRVQENQTKLDAALRNPKCAELLELKVCETVPLP